MLTRLLTIKLLYLVLGLIFVNFYQYLANPDGFSYLDLANKYLRLNLSQAVSSYWSPLYSWLLVPFLSLNLPAFMAPKLLNVVIGIILLLVIEKFLSLFNIKKNSRFFFFVTFLPIWLFFVFSMVTPDLLLAVILLGYFNLIFSANYTKSSKTAFFCGLLGGAAYLAKAYALPFFAVHFLIINLMQKRNDAKFDIARFLSFGYVALFLVSLPWILIISDKERFITFGTSPIYNHAVVFRNAAGYTLNSDVILEPSNESATSPWEDPNYVAKKIGIVDRSMLSSFEDFKYQIYLILRNLWETVWQLTSFSVFSIPILILLAIRQRKDRIVLCFFVTFFIYSLGYLYILVEDRYLWILEILILVFGIKLIGDIRFKKQAYLKYFLIFMFMLSFWTRPLGYLREYLNIGFEGYETSKMVKKQFGGQGRIVSNDKGTATAMMAYFLRGQFLGQTGNVNESEILDAARKFRVDYYFEWDMEYPLLSQSPIYAGSRLRIYQVN